MKELLGGGQEQLRRGPRKAPPCRRISDCAVFQAMSAALASRSRSPAARTGRPPLIRRLPAI